MLYQKWSYKKREEKVVEMKDSGGQARNVACTKIHLSLEKNREIKEGKSGDAWEFFLG